MKIVWRTNLAKFGYFVNTSLGFLVYCPVLWWFSILENRGLMGFS
jgi:hypothetical protein